ncbi:trans-sulfuration enzyme family protein [Thermogemmatispora sp.]|uniref:trans-sulfuration enzyme family protein n=1 Tax=Thermogemmatispora sp. TaxID=1968838 RepID=UPI001DC17F44|nr:PLP-dependent aspartate aminotransferase family protein [Thermogemmatispora sp.]MBX5450815.1 PLP-dependent transferase [Thermogemmatispora sp.]
MTLTVQHSSAAWKLETHLVQDGRQRWSEGPAHVSTVQPIYASTTYLHGNMERLDQAFRSPAPGEKRAYVYARQGNPNATQLEEVLARAEGGVGAVAFGSGMAAIHAALLAAGAAPGTKILAAQDLYGQTIALLRQVFAPQGVEIVLCDLCCASAAERIISEQPDIVFVETISNPLVKVTDLDAISAAAREVGAVTLVDSTFTTPCLLRPIEHGFDLVIHSATKYLGGHGDSTGGLVVSARTNLLQSLRSYASLLGAMLSPFESYLILRGVKTLALRMARHCENALRIAHFLRDHPAVARVHYPGLPEHPQHEQARRLLAPGRFGGLLSFELKAQTRAAVFRFMDSLQLCAPATSLGDVHTLVSYPPVSSHRDLSHAELQQAGITEGCVRLSVGIEDAEDIMYDLDQALQQATA